MKINRVFFLLQEETVFMDRNYWISGKEAAQLLGLNRQTLANWRHLRRGPIYSKLGRSVRYRISDLVSFAESKRIEVKN